MASPRVTSDIMKQVGEECFIQLNKIIRILPSLKLASAIFYQIFISHQVIALQKL